jgi:hypothetical protein
MSRNPLAGRGAPKIVFDLGAVEPALVPGSTLEVAEHLYKALRGTATIWFSQTVVAKSSFTPITCAGCCEQEGVPNVFWAHHGSLSQGLARGRRERAEGRLQAGNRHLHHHAWSLASTLVRGEVHWRRSVRLLPLQACGSGWGAPGVERVSQRFCEATALSRSSVQSRGCQIRSGKGLSKRSRWCACSSAGGSSHL